MAAKPPPPLAAAASPTSRPPRSSWALLDSRPAFVNPEQLPTGFECAIQWNTPPGVSSLTVTRELVPADDPKPHARVESTSSAGHILLSVCPSSSSSASEKEQRPGSSPFLLVCQPGTGAVDLLPAVPDELRVRLKLPPAACTGIFASPGASGYDYEIIQLQPAAADLASSQSSSSSAPKAHFVALCYSKSSSSWAAKEVAADIPRRFEVRSDEEEDCVGVEEVAGELPIFQPHTVISDESRHLLVFADLHHALLMLLDPMGADAAIAARIVPFPAPEDGGLAADDVQGAAARRCVACVEGTVGLVEVSQERLASVSMFCLSDHDLWLRRFRVVCDEIIWSDVSLGRRLVWRSSAARLWPVVVDPTNLNRVGFFSNAGIGFTVEVEPRPREEFPRVRICGEAVADSTGSRSFLAFRFPCDAAAAAAGSSAWIWKTPAALTGGGKLLARMAWEAAKTGSDHVHELVPLAALAASASVAGAAPAVEGVACLVNINLLLRSGAALAGWIWTPRSSSLDVRVIGAEDEGSQVMEEWIASGKPKNVLVLPAPGMNRDQVSAVRELFEERDATQLLPLAEEDFVMVPAAPRDFS